MSRHFELMQQMEAAERARVPQQQPSVAQEPVVQMSTATVKDPEPVTPFNETVVEAAEPAALTHEPVVKPAELAAPPQEPVAIVAESTAAPYEPVVKPYEAPAKAAEPAPRVVTRPVSNVPAGMERKRWASAEALRLVQQIFLAPGQTPPRVVVFAGVDYGNGSNEVCASVAETLAKNVHGSVCLVEANFRFPGLRELFYSTQERGLKDALLEDGPIRAFTEQIAPGDLSLLSSGVLAADSPNLLSSPQLGKRLSELRGEFDFVVVHASPLIRYSDAILLGQLSDGVVMVLSADSTQREAASDAATSIRASKIPILAAVLHKRA